MKRYLLASLLVAVVAAVLLWPRPGGERDSPPARGLPWQIELLPDGHSKVFGLTLAESTIEDALATFGKDVELAVIARSGEEGTLEGYYGDFAAGPLTGKLILVADAEAQTIRELRERAVKSGIMDSGARKFALHPEDLPIVLRARIATLTFIPSANFDADTALKHFGTPAERMRVNEHAENLLYPHLGLDLLLDAKGKEVLQYVAPREFERLRAPLRQASSQHEERRD